MITIVSNIKTIPRYVANFLSFIEKYIFSEIHKSIKFIAHYFSKISNLSKKMVYLQLIDKESRKKNHDMRKKKNIYYQ